ncbi:uncharacterized protein LOC144332725 isoform X2 [Macaca mulatta]
MGWALTLWRNTGLQGLSLGRKQALLSVASSGNSCSSSQSQASRLLRPDRRSALLWPDWKQRALECRSLRPRALTHLNPVPPARLGSHLSPSSLANTSSHGHCISGWLTSFSSLSDPISPCYFTEQQNPQGSCVGWVARKLGMRARRWQGQRQPVFTSSCQGEDPFGLIQRRERRREARWTLQPGFWGSREGGEWRRARASARGRRGPRRARLGSRSPDAASSLTASGRSRCRHLCALGLVVSPLAGPGSESTGSLPAREEVPHP